MFDEDVDFARACPSPEYLFPSRSREYVGDVRAPLANHVADKCPVKRVTKRSLLAADFNSGNPEHLDYIKVCTARFSNVWFQLSVTSVKLIV